MKNIIFLSALLALVGLGCTKKTNDNELVIGSYSSNTGATATFGVFQKNGIEMAIEEINAAGGINGKKIKHINYDNKSDNDETLAVVNRLISQDNVLAVLGEATSGKSKIGAQVAQQNKVVMLSPSATNPEVTQIGNYIFRSCFVDPFQGYVMAKFMTENLKFKKAAILRDIKSDYSVGLSNVFTQELKKMGGEIVDDISYQELYGRVLEKSPIIITVSRESVPDIKRGITNAKHAARKKALYHGLPWDSAILRFETQETENEKERKFYIDLKISAERKAFFSKKE